MSERSAFWKMLCERIGETSPTAISRKLGKKRADTMFRWATGFAYPSWDYCKTIGVAFNVDPVDIYLDVARCKIIEIEGEDYFNER